MRREDKKKLTINRRIIVNHLHDLESVLDYLISKQTLTPSIRERINSENRVPSDRIRHMLDHLITRNALSYQHFLDSLCLTGNSHIANILEPEYTQSEQCKLMLEREKIPLQSSEITDLPYPITCTQTHDEMTISNSVLTRLISSRSNSSSYTSSSSPSTSMSPVLHRARSSSVTALKSDLGETPSTYNITWSDVNSLELDFSVYRTVPDLRKQLKTDECYQMEQELRGLCLIINNEHFYDTDGDEIPTMRRYGTDMDASRLKNLFEKLNFSVEMFIDLREFQMRDVINSFAAKSEANSARFDAICLIVLSHGTDGYVYGVDFENRLNMDKDILNIFDDVLVGKPKLFIFQACRGEYLNQKDTLTHSLTSPALTSSVITSTRSFTGNCVEDETVKKFKQLKMSSLASGTLQMMYKKKTSTTNVSCSTQIKKTRSRSHSRGKYSSYLVSAASAIRTAIRTSPSSTKTLLTSISTQTSKEPVQEQCSTQTANCYLNSSIIATSTTQSLSNFIDGRPIKTFLPSRSDFFIWYSSVRGFVSHRDVDGSPFIKCLVTVFSKCAYEMELIEMVRKVNHLMQHYEKKHFDERNAVASYFMVPVAEFHLTKRLYFNP